MRLSLRRRPRVSPETRAAMTAQLECATEVCAHMVDGQPHPQLVQNREGRQFWRYADGSHVRAEGALAPVPRPEGRR